MASTYRYIACIEENQEIFNWFSTYTPDIIIEENVTHLWFSKLGELARNDDKTINQKESPIVSVFPVKKLRGALLSVGEVHFLTNRMKVTFPELEAINKKFRQWLKKNKLIFSTKPSFSGEWNYYLEGSVRNYDPDIYAFPKGFNLLQSEQYFVSEDDSKGLLDTVCKSLALRGVAGLKNA